MIEQTVSHTTACVRRSAVGLSTRPKTPDCIALSLSSSSDPQALARFWAGSPSCPKPGKAYEVSTFVLKGVGHSMTVLADRPRSGVVLLSAFDGRSYF